MTFPTQWGEKISEHAVTIFLDINLKYTPQIEFMPSSMTNKYLTGLSGIYAYTG